MMLDYMKLFIYNNTVFLAYKEDLCHERDQDCYKGK